MTKSKSLLPEFRRFTNAIKNQGEARQRWWAFTADQRAGIVVVAVNGSAAPEKAAALERLVRGWKGEVFVHE